MITLILIIMFVILIASLFWPEKKGDVYTYVQEKDEDGNIVEKVIDHTEDKDK